MRNPCGGGCCGMVSETFDPVENSTAGTRRESRVALEVCDPVHKTKSTTNHLTSGRTLTIWNPEARSTNEPNQMWRCNVVVTLW